ncbi:hypothetical protein ACIA8R_01115 [Nonomuraea sp. NPDC051191]|uniref:hypothetical protein n=1 Tax=Nonomuraea sp. NPDC051191 TaxID=3364372 RepID=UPI0037970ED4
MARTKVGQSGASSLAVRRVPMTFPDQDMTFPDQDMTFPEQGTTAERADRMARFAAGARGVVVRAVTMGALVAAGWLLAVVFGMMSAAPAAADATAATTGAADAAPAPLSAPVQLSASDNAEAMAGRTVDGLNSQQDPGLPPPSSAGKILDTNGLVPNGGGSGPFGPGMGDVARSGVDPRLQYQPAVMARVLPPVVRTAADDPSFSPD